MRFRTRFRTLAIAAALSAGFAPHKGAEAPVVAAGRAPRAHRDIGWSPVATLPGWRAQWDRDTDVPLRLWGPSLAAPRASADPAAAEAAARDFLATHLDLLAPGAVAADFALVANQLDPSGAVRTVAFVQRARGLAVVGGSVGFAFERDQLMMVSSTALPNVAVRMPGGVLSPQTIATAAIAWLGQAGHAVAVRGHGDRVIVPIVRPRGHSAAPDIEYRVVETISVEDTREAGRWDVWIDAADGSPVARRTTINFASGIVNYNVPDRYPISTRGPKPAPFTTQTVNGAAATSALDGTITWAAAGNATVAPGLAGTYAAITNKSGALATASLTLAPGGSVVWDLSTDEQADAQLDAFVYENTVKHFVLSRLNPNLAWAMQTVSVTVNEPMTCNAYSTGDDVHFFIAKAGMCENTGRIADVVYHETGHSVHYNSLIPGQGQFDGSLSEGLADTMAVSIIGDPGMGRGFFLTNAPLRDLNPTVKKKYPQDFDGEVHDDGEIIGETLWDLRTALQTKLGTDAGYAQTLKIYYGIMQRAADIPSSYAEALVADDDDGNLANGTPNQCEINAAFGAHGLADPSMTIGLQPPTRDGFTVSFTVSAPTVAGCTPPTVQTAVLDWSPHGGTGGQVMLAASGSTWSGLIPTQPDGSVVDYSVTVTLSDGSSTTYPENPADPKYQFYVGPVTPIQCFDFESGAQAWTHGATPAANDDWQVGPPMGIGGDPKTAHGGTNVLGIALGGTGLYQPNTKQWAMSPEIDLAGNTHVRLQYWRWLGVEDGAYDHANIVANDQPVWTNYASPGMPMKEVNHVDKEWRFQDVDLSAQATTGKLTLKFELDSDPGLELGGWTVDDVCVVAIGAAGPTCGNGVVDPGEACDDGAQNGATGDPCSATCQLVVGKAGGGCCSAGGNPRGPAALSLLTVGLVLRRRRRWPS